MRTSVLVAAPLCYVFAAAAVSYLLPAAFLREAAGAALPLIPAATFIGALAVLVAGARWFTRDAAGQTGLAVAAYLVAGLVLRLLDPFRSAGHPFAAKGTRATPELFVLSGEGYLVLLLLMAAIYLGVVFAVGRQRHGEEELIGSDARTHRSLRESGDILGSIRDTYVQLFRWQCPVASLAAAIPAGTLVALRKALAAGILTARQVAMAAIAWLLFAVLALDLLHSGDLMNTPPAIAALLLASTILPLMAVGLAPLSLGAIRHA